MIMILFKYNNVELNRFGFILYYCCCKMSQIPDRGIYQLNRYNVKMATKLHVKRQF